MDFFAAATPCNPLGRYAQNDKGLFVILIFRKKAKYPLVKPHLWLFRKSQSLHYLLEIVLFYALIHQKQIRPYTKNFILYYPLNLGILLKILSPHI